jgi:peptidoglycan/LPS O-acetylase OafA/YrhL
MGQNRRMSSRLLSTLPPAAQRAELLDLLAVVIGGALIVFVVLDGPTLPRILLTLGFTFFVPGRAIMTHWPRLARWSQVGMSIVFSLSALTLIAMTALWAHYWHPVGIFEAEAVLSLAALVAGLVRRRWSPADDRDQAGPQRSWSRAEA